MSAGAFFNSVNSFITDYILTAILIITGLFLTVKTDFIQLRCLKEGLKNTFSGLFSKEKKDGISPFAALCTSLAAQLGTGNIVGAGSAILTGGPGAVFWIWLSSFFGMATAYCEGYFAQKTKKALPCGEFLGGAAFYIQTAFSRKTGKFLAGAFSFFSLTALGFTGVAVQSNSISAAVKEGFSVPAYISGILITIFAAAVIRGGTKKIAAFSEKTVPLLTALYFAVCLAVLFLNIEKIPEALLLILKTAFSTSALKGAINGITLKTIISQGIKRGLFTNEAGMGSCASAHAITNAPTPHFQGTLAIAGVFTDTFVMMTLTALCIITVLFTGNTDIKNITSGSQAVVAAFSAAAGQKGAAVFTCISVIFFAFASITGWNLSGKNSCIYLFGEKSEGIYTAASLMFVFLGTVFPSSFIWSLTDFFNTFMVLINTPALIKLSSKTHFSTKSAIK